MDNSPVHFYSSNPTACLAAGSRNLDEDTEKAVHILSNCYMLHTDPNMNEKNSYEVLTQATSELKVEDDGTADRKILIAVDFGTTFSGVAWAQTRRV